MIKYVFTIWIFIIMSVCADEDLLLTQIQTSKNMTEVNKIVKEIVVGNQYKTSIKSIESYLHMQKIANMRALPKMLIFADMAKFLKVMSLSNELSPEFILWLSETDRRTDLLYSITPEDNLSEALSILNELYKHDSKEISKFWNLSLAIALVWDDEKKLMHRQMGKDLLSYSWQINELYDYYKALYTRGAKVSYSKLSIQDLIFVVGVNVPLEELYWARKNCDGSAKSWSKRYFEIKYNHVRLNASRYRWDQGTYTLANIKELGGICVDQAYYTVISARANGIPAMYFSGMGRSSTTTGHAWAGVMKDGKTWDLEIGRYSQGNYGTGKARDPQTNQRLTDHQVDFKSNPLFTSDKHIQSLKLTSLAKYFLKLEKEDCAEYLYKKSLTYSKMNLKNYAGLKTIYSKRENPSQLIQVMKLEMNAFKKYDDFVYELGTELVDTLTKAGKTSEAKSLQKSLVRKVEDRYDLAESATQNMVTSLYNNGKAKEGRRAFERYIDDQPDFYNTLHSDLKLYYDLTKEHDQAKYAVRFLKDMMKGNSERKAVVQEFLYKAYIDLGDERNAKKLLQ
jgi:hypothetical protein